MYTNYIYIYTNYICTNYIYTIFTIYYILIPQVILHGGEKVMKASLKIKY